MPLLVITGIPCSGKTTRTSELKEYFEKRHKKVEVISEVEAIKKAGYDKNTYFAGLKTFIFHNLYNKFKQFFFITTN